MATFIKLNPIHGQPVAVNVDLALFVRDIGEKEYGFGDGARGEINLLGSQGGVTFTVAETRDQILALIETEEAAS